MDDVKNRYHGVRASKLPRYTSEPADRSPVLGKRAKFKKNSPSTWNDALIEERRPGYHSDGRANTAGVN